MAWRRTVLVVANVTATSDELLGDLVARAQRGPVTFTLVVPATPVGGGRAAAQAKLHEAVERLSAAGLEVDGSVGASDPISAVSDAWDPKRYDEIVVSTLPMRLSTWLRAGLPERIAKLTGAPVSHIVSAPARAAMPTVPAPVPQKRGVMAPLSVLSWGGHRQE